ncbi:vacuolar protein sorting-associated protein 8 homolog isoform X2 [Lineus longissimus]|uniref:vacuolar protein sorting-associated protein 8 homolog isoform X2 n=1 Tax=Lineus longissimus TaxID=88925 RepID=UPI00315D8808
MADGAENAQVAADKMELNLEELDADEFDLPAIESAPTLESILNEPDDGSVFGDDDLVLPPMFPGDLDQGDTSSMSSQEGILDTPKSRGRKKQRKSIRYEEHGSIMRHVVLKGISAQLMSAADRVDAGMPTAMAVSELIAIGTSHGLVLVFDPKQVLKWCLGSTAVGAQYGSVSALSFNRDCTRLLCGFAKGQITMWDLTNGKLIRTISDAHPPGTAILHVKFTDDLTIAVCNDSGGSVFELEMKRLIGVRTCESRCLFSGSRGEVCTIEPLHMNHTIKDHPMKDVLVLAMGTLSKVLVVTIRPKLKVIFSHALKGDPATLPLLAWQFVIIQVSAKDRVIDPVLAFARDQTIYYYQAICTAADDIRFCSLQKMETPYKLLAIQWINPRTLIALDTSEKIHILDVKSEEELEVIDVGEVQLSYGTSHFKSLATGGNVSKALAFAGECACYQSIICHNGQLLLMGTKSIHVLTMRNWEERIENLVKQNNYQDALTMAQSFYEGKAKAVIGLLGGQQKRKKIVAAKMLDLLQNYVDISMTKNLPERGKMEELEEYYQNVVPICVDYCLTLGRTDVLFGEIYVRFSMDQIAKSTFLECLEPYIITDRLTSVTPSVMKDFIDNYEAKGMLQNVEACIVHLDVSSLDIHQVVVLCWGHGLYDAIIYVYNKGMQDYTTPLEELLRILRMALSVGKQLSDDQIRLGNKLLVYISCCLAGRAYPLGDIPAPIVNKVKADVFKSVTCLHTKEANTDEPVYPHLRTLLQFDTREFLNVLALAFEEAEFNTDEGIQKRQRVVDILLQVMVESIGFSPTQVGILFTFLARQMARHENTILVNRVLFEQVLEFLSSPGDESRHEERQQALLELLNAGGFEQFDETRLLTLAENAKFYRVCELLYEKRREFDKILSCYWRDPSRKYQAFAYIESIIVNPLYTEEEKDNVRKEALLHLEELILIDSKKTAQLVLIGFSRDLVDIVKKLENNTQVTYEFLKGVFEYRETTGSAIYTDRQITIEPQIHEKYIELMCQFHPSNVYNYIKGADGYRLPETLLISKRHRVPDATAFLLEKSGDIQGAFAIILESVKDKILELEGVLIAKKDTQDVDEAIAIALCNIQTVLIVIIQLCQRNSKKLEEDEREALWFPLLEVMMSSQRRLKDQVHKELWDDFKQLTRHVLNSMMGYIALPAILQKIMQDPTYSTGKFGEIRELILGMLETYNYEKTLLHTCNSLLNHDLHLQLAGLHSAANHGIIPRGDACNTCYKQYNTLANNESIVVFRCGHGYHTQCLYGTDSYHIIDGEEVWVCFLCTSTKRGHTSQAPHLLRSLSNPGQSAVRVSIKDRGARSKESPIKMSEEQMMGIDALRRNQKTASRLAILTELARPDTRPKYRQQTYSATTSGSILQNENFQLRLAPPPLDIS